MPKTVIKFTRIGSNMNPAPLEFKHEEPMPHLHCLEEAICKHISADLPDHTFDLTFESDPATDSVTVSVALDGGKSGYGAGAVVQENEPPC